MIKIVSFVLTFNFSLISMAHTINDLEKAYTDKGADYKPRTEHIDSDGRAEFVNHLILESSPYLLQHAHNPVNWYAFSDEAFEKAKAENKPIFISIGYATCHWCHVMEEESFDDTEVAQFINKHFVAIKVDREIRPDIDATYMNVSQLLTGSGGWPLNAALLPNGRAFFAGTYFPKPTLLDILSQIQKLWQNEQDQLIQQADKIYRILYSAEKPEAGIINGSVINDALGSISANFDELEGGFGQAPKFPHESILLFLLNEQKRNPTDDKLNIITTTLDNMASGGLYDVVGGGFHRYSTDNSWLVPHFEKMLYNQAHLSLVYIRAYQLTQRPLYKLIAKQTLDYLLREMRHHSGGFFSATDADSEGEEGTFFVWSIGEIKSILSKEEFDDFELWFDLSQFTNFEGSHIIRYKNIKNINPNEYTRINSITSKLYHARDKRIPPLTDNKILLSWNSLLLTSFLEAGDVFHEKKYSKAGIALADYLYSHFIKNNELYRVSIDNQLEARAIFEDYAYLSNGLLSVFDYTLENVWLDRVISLVNTMNERFWDDSNYGFNISDDNKYINSSLKESYDGAIPSTNGIAYKLLLGLNERTNNKTYTEQAQKILSAFASEINSNPYNYSTFIFGFNNYSKGELGNIQYAYQGRIRVHTKKLDEEHVVVKLTLKPKWHINSSSPLQGNLIATSIENIDTKNWSLLEIEYPKARLVKLGFSDEEVSVYENQIDISIKIKNNSTKFTNPSLNLSLQACSDKVCLPPTNINLRP
jgi:uncharacterized protein YyaL (SSP411 family)